MSRIAKAAVEIPEEVEVDLDVTTISIKGKKGHLQLVMHPEVSVEKGEKTLTFANRNNSKTSRAMSGTMRALVNNMVTGVSVGFERRLLFVGVGYRAQVKGDQLQMSLGFSHPVHYQLPSGVSAEAISQTEVALRSSDKQQLGQVAAEIRAFRPPEPYKGKGIRYAHERVRTKEAKKK